MKIWLVNPRGFCAGVTRAIETVDIALAYFGKPIYVLHEIVHNRYVVNDLSSRGAIFVEKINEIPAGNIVIFSAHGVAKDIFKEAAQHNLQVIDATCPLVTKVHLEVIKYHKLGFKIILIGHPGHPEVIGTAGQINIPVYLVSSTQEAKTINLPTDHSLAFVTQTTLSIDDTKEIIEILQKRFPNITGSGTNDICYATQNRQNATKILTDICDLLLVLGSKNSSNSNRLQNIGQQAGISSYLIDSLEDIDESWFKGVKNVGITAGASAPEVLVQNLTTYLQDRYQASIETISETIEKTIFKLPKKLQELQKTY